MTVISDVYAQILEQCRKFYFDIETEEKELLKRDSHEEDKLFETKAVEREISDLLIIGNSFLYREGVKTNKNSKYLGFHRFPPYNIDDIVVATGLTTTNDWKFISKKMKNYPVLDTIQNQINLELDNLGKLVYILIGQFGATKEIIKNFSLGVIKSISFDVHCDEGIKVLDSTLILDPKQSDDVLWGKLIKIESITEKNESEIRKIFLMLSTVLEKN